jgi:hypothetical protein
VLTADPLRPAAIAAGVKLKKGQRFGFHNLRHGLATWLVNQGTGVKTVQGPPRHANVATTLGLYAHRVNSSMIAAQDSVPIDQQPWLHARVSGKTRREPGVVLSERALDAREEIALSNRVGFDWTSIADEEQQPGPK